jgi:predicted dehydrogenase
MSHHRSFLPRRDFLRSAGALAAGALVPTTARGRARRMAANDRITVGIVGVGSRGFNLIDDFVREPDAQIVAVCDVDALHYRDRPWGRGTAFGREPARQRIQAAYANQKPARRAGGVDAYADFRQLCARDDIDAIVVATPDHWHALIAIQAMRAGKDVYCEKPLSHHFQEGQLICREADRCETVFQVGSQQRSDPLFRRAVELVRNSHLGRIRTVEVGLPPGYAEPQGDTTVQEPPEHLDYDLWCGPAPRLPYMQARHHRWWRGHRAFGGGVLMDWIGHHNDIAHWALDVDQSGPVQVEAVGWTWPETDVYNTPHRYEIRCTYPGEITGPISDRNRTGAKWIGDAGWIFVTRGKLEASDPRWTAADFDPGASRVPASPGHVRNFLDCIRSRDACVAPPSTAHRSITPGFLGYVSDSVARPVSWDPEAEQIVGDERADQLLKSLSYRNDWELPT